MLATAVTFFDVVVFVHITAVVVGFGPTFAYGVLFAVAARSDPRALPALGKATSTWDRIGVTGGGVIVLITGIYLAADRFDFGTFFVNWGLIAVIVLLGITHGYFLPKSRKAVELAERDIKAAGGGEVSFSAEYQQLTGQIARMGSIVGLIVVLTIYVMTAKPF